MINDRRIAEAIVLAQVASDGGKLIDDIYTISKRSRKTWLSGYDSKDAEIMRAIKMILSSKESSFRFYVHEEDPHHMVIVYFDWRKNGIKKQISFHSFNHDFAKFSKKAKYATRWDEKVSRSTAIALAKFYKL